MDNDPLDFLCQHLANSQLLASIGDNLFWPEAVHNFGAAAFNLIGFLDAKVIGELATTDSGLQEAILHREVMEAIEKEAGEYFHTNSLDEVANKSAWRALVAEACIRVECTRNMC
jgi:hypothetical protein